MAIFLPVAPPHMLTKLGDDYPGHFYLAHEVVKDAQAYRDLHTRVLASNPTGIHTILDNSVIELGGAVDLEMVSEALDATQARVVVLPDVLEQGEATAEAVATHGAHWFNELVKVKTDVQMMAVPQGETLQAWVKCLEDIMLAHPWIQWIGIPRNTPGRIIDSRRHLISIVRAIAPRAKIHLLGFSENMADDLVSALHDGVTSIDSAVPARVEQFRFGMTTEPRPANWWDEGTLSWEQARSIEYVNRVLRTSHSY